MQGNLALCMNTSQHVYNGALGHKVMDQDHLAVQEPINTTIGKSIGPELFHGSKPLMQYW